MIPDRALVQGKVSASGLTLQRERFGVERESKMNPAERALSVRIRAGLAHMRAIEDAKRKCDAAEAYLDKQIAERTRKDRQIPLLPREERMWDRRIALAQKVYDAAAEHHARLVLLHKGPSSGPEGEQ